MSKRESALLQVGPSEQHYDKTENTIIDILNTDGSDDVKKRALEALSKVSKIENITVTNSHFEG